MSSGIIQGAVNPVPVRLGRGEFILPIAASQSLVNVNISGNTFQLTDTGAYVLTVNMLPAGSEMDTPFSVIIYDETAGAVAVETDLTTVPQSSPIEQTFTLPLTVSNASHFYSLRILTSEGQSQAYALSLSGMLFQLVIQGLGGGGGAVSSVVSPLVYGTPPTTVAVLLVGAGGSGGSSGNGGAGGGGGQVVYNSSFAVGIGAHTVTIGVDTVGNNGGTTSFDSLSAVGGNVGGNGGTNPGGSSGSGHSGGTSFNWNGGGGGGGDAAVGGNGVSGQGGVGGAGTVSTITGSSVYYGGGGGGSGYPNSGAGGAGGGGAGNNNGGSSTVGTDNTGGGGGGNGNSSTLVKGGSGVVIIKATAGLITASYSGAYSFASAGGYDVWTLTSNGTFTITAISGASALYVNSAVNGTYSTGVTGPTGSLASITFTNGVVTAVTTN